MSDADFPRSQMIAVVPVRSGVLPLGADETVAEAGGWVLLIGSGCDAAANELRGVATRAWCHELHHYEPRRWAEAAAALLPELEPDGIGHLLLPGSPDGRDLGPHLAVVTDRALVAGAITIDATSAEVTRYGGQITDRLELDRAVVATLQPGVRGVAHDDSPTGTALQPIDLRADAEPGGNGPRLLEVLPADPSTMDLAEADRIIGGGAGLGSAEALEEMRVLAARLGASPGGTRVITDWGWLPVERQIGTTGVNVDPSLYIALGVSGAVQHTAGLGSPDHIISVNRDPHCPMMAMADLALVCDCPSFLRELLARL